MSASNSPNVDSITTPMMNLTVSGDWKEVLSQFAVNFQAWSVYRKNMIATLIATFPTWKDIQANELLISEVIMCALVPNDLEQGLYRATDASSGSQTVGDSIRKYRPTHKKIKAIIGRVYTALQKAYTEFGPSTPKELFKPSKEEIEDEVDEKFMRPTSVKIVQLDGSTKSIEPEEMSIITTEDASTTPKKTKAAKVKTPILEEEDEDEADYVDMEDENDPASDEDDEDSTPKCVSLHIIARLMQSNISPPPMYEHGAGRRRISAMLAMQKVPMTEDLTTKNVTVVCIPSKGQRAQALKDVVAYGKPFMILLPVEFITRPELRRALDGVTYQISLLPYDVRMVMGTETVFFNPSFLLTGKRKAKPLVPIPMAPANVPSRAPARPDTDDNSEASTVIDFRTEGKL